MSDSQLDRVGPLCRSRSGYGLQADHLSPCTASFRQELSSSPRRVAIATAAEVITNGTERLEKPLRLLRRLEPPHRSFSLPRRLV